MFDQFQIIAAPMAGITDGPFRTILRRCNPGLPIMTEMISCHSITAKKGGRNDDEYAKENTGAQIFGADPVLMAEAARILAGRGAAWIDINMGCPVPKVATRAGAGAFLMLDHALAARIMAAVVGAVKIPVSIKTRLGWDEKHLDSADLLRIAAESGVAFAAVHARTRAQGYSGRARPREIPMPQKIPVIFNGDIRTATDVAAVRDMGAAGAMIGRAMLGHPFVFSEVGCLSMKDTSDFCKKSPHRIAEIVAEHFDLAMSYYGAKTGVPMFRKHLAWYAAGRQGASTFRMRVNQITDPAEMQKAIAEFFI